MNHTLDNIQKELEPETMKEILELKDVNAVENADEAKQIAIGFQNYVSEKSLSYSEVAEFQGYFTLLADKFDLTDEFIENGII